METELQDTAKIPDSSNGTQSGNSPNILEKKMAEWYIARTADKLAFMQLIRKYEGEFYMLNGIVYHPLDEDCFDSLVFQYAQSENVTLKPAHCRQILKSVLIRTMDSPCAPDCEDYTVVKNGLISNGSGLPLQEMPPDYFATIYVDANYLSDMPLYHPTADAFLATISGSDPELIARHWEFWGYVLSSD